MFAVNVRAPFFLMQEAIEVMRREGTEGTIVNIGSMSAKAGQPFIAAYCASKGALETLTKNTAYAVLRNRIRVNGLNLGWMASEGEDRIQREFHGAASDWLEKAAASQPFGRLVDPAEVARACAYLSSAESRPDDRLGHLLRPVDLGSLRRFAASCCRPVKRTGGPLAFGGPLCLYRFGSGARENGRIGNPVKIRDVPNAVTGTALLQ